MVAKSTKTKAKAVETKKTTEVDTRPGVLFSSVTGQPGPWSLSASDPCQENAQQGQDHEEASREGEIPL